MTKYSGADIKVDSYERDGYFVLRISKNKVFYANCKKNRNGKTEKMWTAPIEKRFDSIDEVNAFVAKIKDSNPDMIIDNTRADLR